MFFHFVKSGDSIYELSKRYKVPSSEIISTNSLINPTDLVINQCLLIPQKKKTYLVESGDTLQKIAQRYGLTLNQLIQLNPTIPNINQLKIGQEIIIDKSLSTKKEISVNGYCYENSSKETVKKALPYLTYLSIFSYTINEDGSLNKIDDQDWISLARQYQVKPIMAITNMRSKGGFSPSLASSILKDENRVTRLMNEIDSIASQRGYYGIHIDFEYISPEDKQDFLNFIKRTSSYFKSKGYLFSVALAPKYNENQKGLLYESHDYEKIGEYADHVILMTYEWGYTYGPAMAVAPFNEVKKVIQYATEEIQNKKIWMGIPNYGYDFLIPFEKGRKAKSISNPRAIPLAFDNHVQISRNEKSKTPYFQYKKNNQMHEVHYDDPCSYQEKLSLVDDYHLGGISIWTTSLPCEYLYALIDYFFKIKKIR